MINNNILVPTSIIPDNVAFEYHLFGYTYTRDIDTIISCFVSPILSLVSITHFIMNALRIHVGAYLNKLFVYLVSVLCAVLFFSPIGRREKKTT